ncbi:MAG: Transcriptional regulator, AraC family, partial [uncultured Actinomycetospora sp.]
GGRPPRGGARLAPRGPGDHRGVPRALHRARLPVAHPRRVDAADRRRRRGPLRPRSTRARGAADVGDAAPAARGPRRAFGAARWVPQAGRLPRRHRPRRAGAHRPRRRPAGRRRPRPAAPRRPAAPDARPRRRGAGRAEPARVHHRAAGGAPRGRAPPRTTPRPRSRPPPARSPRRAPARGPRSRRGRPRAPRPPDAPRAGVQCRVRVAAPPLPDGPAGRPRASARAGRDAGGRGGGRGGVPRPVAPDPALPPRHRHHAGPLRHQRPRLAGPPL